MLAFSCLLSVILTAATAQEVYEQILRFSCEKKWLLFFDIDDTLLTPVSALFRKEPHKHLITDIKKNKNLYPHYEQIVSSWRLQRAIMLTDPAWPLILDILKKQFPVFGLTKIDTGSFGLINSMELWRFNELSQKQLFFSETSYGQNEPYYFSLDAQASVPGDASLYRGILMTGKASKPQTVEYFLASDTLLAGNSIIVIDDLKEQLELMQAWATARNIPFVGIHFTGAQNIQGEAHEAIVALQKKRLLTQAQWLEDDQAYEILLKERLSH